jgi:uncharacterized protein YraI
MRRTTIGFAAAVAGLMAAPIAASALTAMTTEPVALRAGPAGDFPIVDSIPDDARVNVHGCVRAYMWCDVSWRDARGWVRGDDLAYYYQQSYVPIIEYGPRIGLPVVVFTFDSYWDRHYRGRPWYGERTRWRTTWRDHDRRDGGRDGDRRQGKIDRDRDRPERKADSTPNRPDRTEKRMDRPKDMNRSREGVERRSDKGGDRQRMSDQRGRDAAPRRGGSPGREANVRERPGRDGGGPGQRGAGGGGRDGGGSRDRN